MKDANEQVRKVRELAVCQMQEDDVIIDKTMIYNFNETLNQTKATNDIGDLLGHRGRR